MFYLPGLCDITSHVEWSSLNRTAAQAGMGLIHYQSQGAYLLHAGIGDLFLEQIDPTDSRVYIAASHAFQKLISEAEMGELFKIIAWNKNIPGNVEFENLCANLAGFTNRQRLLEA
jgi:SAM-dependent MidA family methyltransferase